MLKGLFRKEFANRVQVPDHNEDIFAIIILGFM